MVRLFEQAASKNHVQIIMSGNSFNEPECLQSFDSLALVLIDNAVKYSSKDRQVQVVVYDSKPYIGGHKVMVAVENYGPIVSKDLRDNMFDRGWRGPRAKSFSASGSGLGLYIAKVIADAHGIEIQYKCDNVNRSLGEGRNTFSFAIPMGE